MLTLVIPTIRPTVDRAIDSVLAEGLPCIAVLDGPAVYEPPPRPGLTVVRLGRNYGRLDGVLWYGQIAFDTGVRMSKAEFTGGLGDDDELLPGAGARMLAAIEKRPDVDMWVPGLLYNDGRVACVVPKMEQGNVSHVIYRSKILAKFPMYHDEAAMAHIHDWCHAVDCEAHGHSIDWIGEPCISIRPRLNGPNGHGN